jgi:RNA polymerase sigma factor (sigma-70 family)
MTENDSALLEQFTRDESQDAFSELVHRHLNLVYSAAFRQVRSPDLAEEIALSAFTQLARCAGRLPRETILTAWLYRVACNAAIDVVRREARRQARERIACQMSTLNEPPPEWAQIEGMLDEAMQSLGDVDRTAILLRFFEKKSLREVGHALGASEDAAQKRVGRALEHLREFFAKRKVHLAAASVAALISVNAVKAAPAELAVSLAGSVAASVSTATTVTVTKAIIMTTLQKTIVALILAGAVAAGIYQARQASSLREQNTALGDRVHALEQARREETNSMAQLTAENVALRKRPSDVAKLRGEVGVLKEKNAKMGSSSAISKVTADPATKKLMRDTQKMGMAAIYKNLVAKLQLTPDQGDKFNDLLADHVMQNIDSITTILRDKPGPDEVNRIFDSENASLQQQIQDLLGSDALAQYQDYSKNLLGNLTSQQFKDQLTGTPEEQGQKAAQLAQLISQESQSVVSASGLPADYQTVPILNFQNFVSEESQSQGVQILSNIYQQTAAQAASFLSPEEIQQFKTFQTTAINNSQAALTMNRNLMAPISNP